ncbi:MAG: zinc ribbon domain-containing protein [Acidobacteriia bacterium]|nr:zinc ribbon domain-containing protein [Terriglobia bacterium]
MPIYEFECLKCKKIFSLVIPLSEYEKKKPECPKCGSKQVEQVVEECYVVTSKKS